MKEKQDGLIWEETGIKLRVVEQLRELAGRYGLSKLILFGSRARGDYRRESDIDLTASVGDVALFRLARGKDRYASASTGKVCYIKILNERSDNEVLR